MKDIEIELFDRIVKKAEKVFLNSKTTYSYNEIINGCHVSNHSGSYKTMYAVGSNTWRGFHKKETTSAIGSKFVFTGYFTKNKDYIIENLKNMDNINKLNEFENKLCKNLKELLISHIKENMLNSFNKIRKPVDLYIEHIVSMSEELKDYKTKLIPMLFLPLDSQVFASEHIFTIKELYKYGLKRSSSFKDITSPKSYSELQRLLRIKAIKAGSILNKNFCRIYFDLLWNNRYENPGSSLFETNF
ncbi:hypothetical protein [Clostridium tyrobutyricum]|uniref:hypothetical protein n=1 Tax=Clostridium tyrobutyricum TaxID=1519 RepID=UPI001C381C3B|nr:hypothetical protein [Clostridium tyrobutyricum]MBV4428296.1 hypothetical protein [Clostridium tyrobutyricum]MBV4430569.1 hypothetical protein [Clostridium tyrobutyricum]MBV4443286.1 hypothetical protein [Clostridium tyrobutyricum]